MSAEKKMIKIRTKDGEIVECHKEELFHFAITMSDMFTECEDSSDEIISMENISSFELKFIDAWCVCHSYHSTTCSDHYVFPNEEVEKAYTKSRERKFLCDCDKQAISKLYDESLITNDDPINAGEKLRLVTIAATFLGCSLLRLSCAQFFATIGMDKTPHFFGRLLGLTEEQISGPMTETSTESTKEIETATATTTTEMQ
jgi:hypothetical protein